MNNIKVTNPYLAFIAIPLVIALVVGFFILPKQKRKSKKNLISLVLHFVMVITLTLTFMDIRFLHTSESTEMIILADCSDSNEDNVDELDSAISEIYQQGKDNNYKVGVVAFASSAENVVKLGDSYKSGKIKEVYSKEGFDTSSTNIQTALSYSKDLFSENSIKRIVLVSDGKETDGSAIDSIEDLISDSITIDAVYLNPIKSDEIAITGIEYTDHCFVNKKQQVKVSVYSHIETTARLELQSQGEEKYSQDVTLAKGFSIFTLDLPSDKVGEFQYDVKVSSLTGADDKYQENNIKSFKQDFTDEISVLLLANSQSDLSAIKSLNQYPEKTKIDAYYKINEFPYKLEDFMKYDEIIISDVNISEHNYSTELITNLNTAVKYYGKSLITYGATYSSGSNEYIKKYNDMLPVQYESDEPKALIILIDVSGSMNDDDKIKQAKEGAISCLDLLGDNDYIGVVTFCEETKVIVPLTSAKNKTSISSRLSAIEADGGTLLAPALNQCQDMLIDSGFDSMNVICLSDGLPNDAEDETGVKSLQKQVYKMANKNISVSFINIADPKGTKLLSSLASYGNGAYYYCNSAASIVRTLQSSVSDEIANKTIEENTAIQINAKDDTTLTDVDTSSLPTIGGYNYCRMKSLATTVLTVQYQKDQSYSSLMTIPLYAYWQFGKGRVSSFTSSLSSSWTTSLRSSEAGKKLFQNMANESLPKRKTINNMDFAYTTKGKTTDVVLTSNDGDKSAKVSLRVTCPDNSVANYSLIFDGTSYIATVNTPLTGEYSCSLTYQPSTDGSSSETYTYSLFFDYSSEYDMTKEDDTTLLYNLTKQSGNYYKGTYTLNILDSELQYRSYNSSMVYFLLVSVILFLVDIFIRKTVFKSKRKKDTNI